MSNVIGSEKPAWRPNSWAASIWTGEQSGGHQQWASRRVSFCSGNDDDDDVDGYVHVNFNALDDKS